jgi:hypothetical protein
MGKRQMFILLAFLSGVMSLTGGFSATLAYLGKEFGQKFVVVSGTVGAVLIIAGLALLYYAMTRIR